MCLATSGRSLGEGSFTLSGAIVKGPGSESPWREIAAMACGVTHTTACAHTFANEPAMIVALAQFGGINNRFTEGRWNRMNDGVETGRKFLETLPHRFAADESRIGQSCHVARDLFLQRLKPKLTLPRRAAGKEF